MFLRMMEELDYTGMGSCTGMNKQTLRWFMDLYGIENKVEMLEDMQLMQRHALKYINKVP
jgi:hypothetical protein